MGELIAYGSEVNSVFQLIGTLENDITKSIAWTFNTCPAFLKLIISDVMGIDIDPEKVRIKYQEYEKGKGITDLILTDDDLIYIIIEAKRGWILPGAEQLTMYSERDSVNHSCAKYKGIISMSECSIDYANSYLPFKRINGIPVYHLSWKRIYEIADQSIRYSKNQQKNLLRELKQYLGGLMTMQTKESNWVYVVALGAGKPDDCSISWIDIVEKNHKYFHPLGGDKGGWPKDPPNYIAFRYNGRLQSIHHIEDYIVTKNLHDGVTEMPSVDSDKLHYIYSLGDAIKPSKLVKTGNIYANARVWAMLDTLLTADTISEARDISKSRMNN